MRGAEHHVTFTIAFMYRNASPAFGFATSYSIARSSVLFAHCGLSHSLCLGMSFSLIVCVFFSLLKSPSNFIA